MTNLAYLVSDQLRKDLPELKPGMRVRITQKVREGGKERSAVIEGIIIARKHGKGINATATIRNEVAGVGVEWVLPIHSPTIQKVDVLERYRVRRAKLYYLRSPKAKKLKRIT